MMTADTAVTDLAFPNRGVFLWEAIIFFLLLRFAGLELVLSFKLP